MATHAAQIDFLLAGLRDPDTDLPLAGGTVYFYAVGTTTAKNVWTEVDKTNAFTSYTLDSQGMAELFGDGAYKIVAKDSTGATEYTFDVVKVSDPSFYSRTLEATGTATPADDMVLCNGTFTLTLDPVANFMRPLTIGNIGTGVITVDADASETIGGAATYTISYQNQFITLYPDTTAGVWRIANNILMGAVISSGTNRNITQDELTVNRTFTNHGAGGDIAFTLPAGFLGARARFINVGANYLRVNAGTGQRIIYDGATGAESGYVRNTTLGTIIDMEWQTAFSAWFTTSNIALTVDE